jgi:uncharacterized membrane protein
VKFSKDRLLFLLPILWLILNLLAGTSFNFLQLRNILGFPILVLVPGVLSYLLLGLRLRNFWEKLLYSTAFGVLFLMAVGLLTNFIFPIFGVDRPLDTWPLMVSLDATIAVLFGMFAFFGKFRTKKYHLPKIEFWSAILASTGPFLVLLSIFGAFQLNNGADNYPTMVMLGIAIAYLAILVVFSRKISQNLLLWCLYCVGLALLLMTSLRGWFTTGHDIQREFHVFELTKTTGVWNVGAFRDAYNACLSITILPTIFSSILQVADPFIYKSLFQVIFALVPVSIYLIARRFVDPAMSVITFIYFVSFPTFFGDMAFLNRQEVAFLFLALMLLLIFDEGMTAGRKKIVFLILAVGMIFSHYSTTYITIAVLGAAWVIRVLITRFRFRGNLRRLFSKSALIPLRPLRSHRHLVTLPIVIAVAAGSFLWSSVLTDTSHGLVRTLSESLFNAKQGFSEDAKSADVLYSLFSFQSVDVQKELSAYYFKAHEKAVTVSDPSEFYAETTYSQYQVNVVGDHLLPLTGFGSWLNQFVSVEKFNELFRSLQARVLQLLVVIGLGFLLFRKTYSKKISPEYLAISLGSGLIVMAVVVLPFLSVEYGLLRAFQQALMVLGLFIVIGSLVIFPGRYLYKILFASCLALFMMMSSVGLIPQLLGGYFPQLHLNNAGTYYDVFYTHRSEVLGVSWLQGLVGQDKKADIQSEVQTDLFAEGRVTSIQEVNILNDIYPSLIRRSSYVYLGYSNAVLNIAAAGVNGDTLLYAYPIDFLDQQKNLIYNDGGSRIYK